MFKILPHLYLFLAISCEINPKANKTIVSVSFKNNSADVCHFGIAAYVPDGNIVTRVSNVAPYHTKTYSFPGGTAVYLLSKEQETTVMQGTNLQKRGDKPLLVLSKKDEEQIIDMNQ